METGGTYRPRISRETRLLLTAGVLAVAALWLLARIRFPDRSVTPNPVPAVLSQLASRPRYDDLAAEIGQIQTRLQSSLFALNVPPAPPNSQPIPRVTAAIRIRDDMAVTWVAPGVSRERWDDAAIVAHDPASGLAVARMTRPVPTSPPSIWTARQPQQARYLLASDVSPGGVSVRPVFVGSFDPIESSLWSGPLWTVPERTDLVPGSFLFTTSAELVGLAIDYDGRLAVVPGETILAEADRLVATPRGDAGTIGLEVQDLTAPVASVTGGLAGVVVSWVDPDVAAAVSLMAGDVIESIGGQALATRQQWDMRVARLSVGETVMLGVRRRGELREVAVVATAPPSPVLNQSLGLTLRGRTKIGAEVVGVERASAAERAGLTVGDMITLVEEISAPTPAQVVRSFASLDQGQRVIVAVTRGDAHFVTTLER